MATFNKNEFLPNTLYSIARQKVSFPFEVCIVDDHSDVDPEPIIRKFLPDAKYKRLDKRYGFDVVTTQPLSMMSDDSDILIMQSSDVIHTKKDTIETLCNGVGKKQVCMATVYNIDPLPDMYKNFKKHLPLIKMGKIRTSQDTLAKFYFFLGAIRRSDYESLKCQKGPYCDVILSHELDKFKFTANHPKDLIGFHQDHPQTTIPCTRLLSCHILCSLKYRCQSLGLNSFDNYLKKNRKK
jgi:hypothetical protein